MTNRVAQKLSVAARIGQAGAIAAICGGIAALYWNGVAYCGGGLRQLFLPEQVTFGDGRVQSYIPHCPDHAVRSFALGLTLLIAGVVVYMIFRQALAATRRLNLRVATTTALWGAGLALLGIAIIPVENFAVDSFVEPTRHALMLSSRVSRVPGALLAVGGITMVVLSIRRLRSRS